MKCKWCGKEIQLIGRTKFCCPDCLYNFNLARATIDSRIRTIAKKNGFGMTDNRTKIEKAKIMLFKGGDYMRCPCSADDPERYCGSPKCINEVKEKGICHCHLFEEIR